jgi:hypothetical protein
MSDTVQQEAPRPIEEQAPWIAQVPKEQRGEDLLALGLNLGDVVKNTREIIKERDTLKASSKPKEGVPETPDGYKFTFPADFPKDLMNETDLKAFSAIAHKYKLTPQEAAEFVNFEISRTIASRKAQSEARTLKQKKAKEDLLNEYKEKADERLSAAFAVVDKLGEPGLREELNETAMGDNPKLIKLLVKVGAFLTEKGLMNTGGTGAGPAAASEGPDLKEVYKRSYATGAMK